MERFAMSFCIILFLNNMAEHFDQRQFHCSCVLIIARQWSRNSMNTRWLTHARTNTNAETFGIVVEIVSQLVISSHQCSHFISMVTTLLEDKGCCHIYTIAKLLDVVPFRGNVGGSWLILPKVNYWRIIDFIPNYVHAISFVCTCIINCVISLKCDNELCHWLPHTFYSILCSCTYTASMFSKAMTISWISWTSFIVRHSFRHSRAIRLSGKIL